MQKDEAKTKRRVLASWRMQACSAGLCAGAQVFLTGAGLAVPLCGNSAWIASLAAIPACALAAGICRSLLARRKMGRIGAALSAAAYFLAAVFVCASLVSLAERSLLPQARAMDIAALTAALAALCAACGAGVFRMCFLLRAALPVVLVACAAASLPDRSLSGVFPLLGAGAGPLALSALLMAAGGCAPMLLLVLPPPELEGRAEAFVPGAGFFARRAAAGAGIGCALLFLLCGGGTAQALMGADSWGDRLAMIAGGGAHQGLADTALLLALCVSAALFAACMLQAGARALRHAFPRMGERAWLIVFSLSLLAALAFFTARGMDAALVAAPLAALPAAAAAIAGCRKENRKGGNAA